MTKENCKYGRWPSTVSAQLVAGKTLRFGDVQAHNGVLYWSEQRPQEQGRSVIMSVRLDQEPLDRKPEELLPAPFSARSKVHEYGGGAFLVTDDGIYFVNADDQDLYFLNATNPPKRLTNAPDWRFADFIPDQKHNRLIAIGEIHRDDSQHPDNLIVSIDLSDGSLAPLVEGNDFYAAPRLSPDANSLAFLSWNLPAMPWEAAKLHVASLDKTGAVTKTTEPKGSEKGASFQPEWDRDDNLWFINDQTGFGQLYRFDGKSNIVPVANEAEFGLPLWQFGMKTYGFLESGHIATSSFHADTAALGLVRSGYKGEELFFNDHCSFEKLVTDKNMLAGILTTRETAAHIFSISTTDRKSSIHRQSSSIKLSRDELSIPQNLNFKNERGQQVYGFYYPPANKQYKAPNGALPPVILTAHGGPTAYADCGLKPKIQYWTTRGFGYFDLNYSGSWGFGKAYRQRLDGQWGRRDVADMEAGAHYLVDEGLADPRRLLISGSSAGGYTVLMALTQSNLFAAGASYYGISDLARLHDSTHKFEAGYLETLLGLNKDNREQILKDRSPLTHASKITAPVIFFQGLEDKVVPPDQAELMVEALQKRGIKTRYKSFENEGHGFRHSATIETTLTLELEFYREVLSL